MPKERIATREKDYSELYLDIVAQAELSDYLLVRGCMAIKPNGYAMRAYFPVIS